MMLKHIYFLGLGSIRICGSTMQRCHRSSRPSPPRPLPPIAARGPIERNLGDGGLPLVWWWRPSLAAVGSGLAPIGARSCQILAASVNSRRQWRHDLHVARGDPTSLIKRSGLRRAHMGLAGLVALGPVAAGVRVEPDVLLVGHRSGVGPLHDKSKH